MDRTAIQSQITNKLKEVIAATSLKPYEMTVRATANTATDSYTITLPPVSECRGQIFTIIVTIANSKTITLAHKADSQNWTNLAFTVTNDFAILYSDGLAWFVLNEVTT